MKRRRLRDEHSSAAKSCTSKKRCWASGREPSGVPERIWSGRDHRAAGWSGDRQDNGRGGACQARAAGARHRLRGGHPDLLRDPGRRSGRRTARRVRRAGTGRGEGHRAAVASGMGAAADSGGRATPTRPAGLCCVNNSWMTSVSPGASSVPRIRRVLTPTRRPRHRRATVAPAPRKIEPPEPEELEGPGWF